jgi:nicotinic acid mononucleotide adenylyltransferase
VAEFDLVVVDRPGIDLEGVRNRLEPYLAARLEEAAAVGHPPGAGGRILYLGIPPMPVSSTEIRARASRGLSLDGLVPPSVARYIQRHRLYLTS